ncbi:hypothetical protein B586_19900 [Mycobacterium haemophilum DSM 44634]|nr:hypothetical protein B586_19900 [Mycobacterium haemophilum DSM 44634]MCV7342671.1 hypothetical protein [Mycobacterium haemophilum DSM 44634]
MSNRGEVSSGEVSSGTHQVDLGRSAGLVAEPGHHGVQRGADIGARQRLGGQQGRWRVLVFGHRTRH